MPDPSTTAIIWTMIEDIVMKVSVLITALTGLIFLSIAQGAKTEIPASGVYNGKILKSSACKLPAGDRRVCQSLTVQLDSGKVTEVRLWGGGGAVIYNSNGKVLLYDDSTTQNESRAEMSDRFYKAVGYLKKGVNVRMDNVYCGPFDEQLPNMPPWCETSTIHLK